MQSQLGPVDARVDIAGAELRKPATEGTLLLTETAPYFADLSGKPRITFKLGIIKSVFSEDLTVSATVSDKKVAYEAALLAIASSEMNATFLVDRSAAAELKGLMAILEQWFEGR
jgi:hypothetical protein